MAGPGRRLGRASAWMFAAMLVLNVSMVVYHRLMSSTFGEGYADLAALTNVVNLAFVFTNGLATTLAKVFSTDMALRGPGGVRRRLLGLARPMALGMSLGVLLLALAGPWVVSYLRLPDLGLYLVSVVLVAATFMASVLRSAVQGLHRFGWLSASYVGEGLGRVGMSALLVLGGSGLVGALQGNLFASLVGALALLPLLFRLPVLATRPGSAGGMGSSWRVMGFDTLALGLFASLCYLDGFVVKHYQDQGFAEAYARISLVGRSFLYAGSAMVVVLLPAVAAANARREDARPLLAKFLAAHALLLGLGFGFMLLFRPWVITLLCGPQAEFQSLGAELPRFCLAVIPLALFQLVLLYLLAIGRHQVLWVLGAAALSYWAALEAFHGSVSQVAACLGSTSLAALLAGLALAVQKPRKGAGLDEEAGLAVALQERFD